MYSNYGLNKDNSLFFVYVYSHVHAVITVVVIECKHVI